MKKNNEEGLFRQVRPKILLIMKLTTAFLLMSFLSVSAATLGQRATIKVTNVTLKSVFKEVKQKMGYTFVYNEHDVNQVGKVTLDITTSDVKQVLDKCLENTALGYCIQGDVVVIQKRAEQIMRDVKKESFKITGLVQDKKKEPLPGVTVLLKGTSVGVATDKDGKFSLEVPQMDSVVLVFSFVGMKDKEIAIKKLEKEMKPLTVVMEENEEELSEVVVTGMFNRRKEGFTGSAVSVKGEDLKKISTTNIAKALAAIDPSFRIMEDVLNGSNPNRLPDLRMRGQATLPGGSNAGASAEMVTLQGEYDTYPNKPLLIMDGFEIDLQTMVDMDPDRVESITLLKDAAATAIYGSRAANGVIVIESKVPKEGRLWVTYGGNFRVEIPDLSDYNLMNAEEKLRAEVLAGMYKGDGSIDVLQNYQDKLREVKRGVDTYWLDKPLRTAVQQRHTVTLEGGDRALRYRLYVGYNHTPGVMKGSKRDVMTGSLDLQYRFNKVLLKNSITVDNSVGDESPWGSFSEYAKLNPYLRPYGENGEILKRLDNFVIFTYTGGRTTDYANPMYNATLNTKNRATNFSIRNLFSVEYNPNSDLRLIGSFSLSKGNGKTDVFRPAQHTAFEGIADPAKRGDFRRTQRENFQYSLDLTASYNKLLGEVHYVTANARMSVQESKDENYRQIKRRQNTYFI